MAHGTLRLTDVDLIAGTTVVTAAHLAAGKLVYHHDDSENYTDSFKLVPLDDQGITGGDSDQPDQHWCGSQRADHHLPAERRASYHSQVAVDCR